MNIDVITNRNQAVEFCIRIAERFFPAADDDAPWSDLTEDLPKKVHFQARGAIAMVRIWQQAPTPENYQKVRRNARQLKHLTQQMHQQYNRVFHGQAACAASDSGAREPDRRCGAPQLRIRHVQLPIVLTGNLACGTSAG